MALYAGENVIIVHSATMDGNVLTDADVDSVTVIVFDFEGEEVVAEAEMTWNSTYERWEFDWDTSPGGIAIDAGTYRSRVTVYAGADTNWEYKKIKLKRNPV